MLNNFFWSCFHRKIHENTLNNFFWSWFHVKFMKITKFFSCLCSNFCDISKSKLCGWLWHFWFEATYHSSTDWTLTVTWHIDWVTLLNKLVIQDKLILFATTGWPKSKVATSNGCNSESMHFRPYVGKAKMCLGGVSLFWEIVNKQLKIVNKQLKNENKLRHAKRILALPTRGQKCLCTEL